jgi:hypothetical protein
MKKKLILPSLIVLIISPISYVLADREWNEDFEVDKFEDLIGWERYGYTDAWSDSPMKSSDPRLSVMNGVLRGENEQGLIRIDQALRESTLAYGMWEFDWYVSSGTDHDAWDGVNFIWTDISGKNYNISGITQEEMNYTGYSISIASFSGGFFKEFGGISFINWHQHEFGAIIGLGTYNFTSKIDGNYHFKITRDLTGEFKIFFDSELVIQATNNDTTSSEKFVFHSFVGDSGIDNIKVSEEITTETTESFYWWLFIPSLIVFIYTRNRRRHK